MTEPKDEALREFESAANKTAIERQHAMEAAQRTCLQLRIEIEQWKQRAEKAEAACAEMRVILEAAQRNWVSGKIWTMSANDLNHALSSDCGRGHIPASELDKTIEVLQLCAETLGEVHTGEDFECECHQVGDRASKEAERLESLRKESK